MRRVRGTRKEQGELVGQSQFLRPTIQRSRYPNWGDIEILRIVSLIDMEYP